MRFYFFAFTVFILARQTDLVGQISLTDQDLLGLIGSSFIIEEDTSDMLDIDHGMAGNNQTWDLSQPLNSSFSITREFVDPATTPYASTFATANLAEKITSADFSEGALYNYYEIGSNRAVEVGNASMVTLMGTTFENIEEDNHLVAPLPITINSSWSETILDTTVQAGVFTNIFWDSTAVMVDGWGKIKLPSGEYDCLRLFEQCWTRSQTVINGVIIDSSSDNALSYIWVGKNNFILASVTSQDGETDPNFTNSSSFSRLGGGSTPVTDFNDFSQNLQVVGPNPFSDELQLEVSLDQASDVQLAIFDLKGVRVKTLFAAPQFHGVQQFTWNGHNGKSHLVPAGTYIVSLQTHQGRALKKVQLVR